MRMQIWIDGSFVAAEQASVSVFDHGLLYGDGCFEGMRVYGGRILKLGSHLARLARSCAALRLNCPYSQDELAAAARAAVHENGLTEGYIRLLVTRGKGTLGLHPFKCPKAGVVLIAAQIELYPPDLYRDGLDIIVAKRPRVPAPCLDPAIKSLNYLNNIMAKVEAIDAGCLEAVMLNVDGQVAECTGDNVFLLKDGCLITPHVHAGILHGITRQLVLRDIAPRIELAVRERRVEPAELFSADEVFLTGSAAEIIGVRSIDGRAIANGAVGPLTRRLAEQFRAFIAAGVPED
jgi:branched-chain amino acid aminotransferase